MTFYQCPRCVYFVSVKGLWVQQSVEAHMRERRRRNRHRLFWSVVFSCSIGVQNQDQKPENEWYVFFKVSQILSHQSSPPLEHTHSLTVHLIKRTPTSLRPHLRSAPINSPSTLCYQGFSLHSQCPPFRKWDKGIFCGGRCDSWLRRAHTVGLAFITWLIIYGWVSRFNMTVWLTGLLEESGGSWRRK